MRKDVNLLDEYLTEVEAADASGRKPRTLRSWRRARTGPPPTIIGKTVLYFRPSVVAWLRSQERAEEAA